MKAFAGYENAKVKTGSFELLPKGAYVLKILNVKEAQNSKGGSRFDIAFDIAEGDYKDFYQNQFNKNKESNEDAKYSNDGIYRLMIPEDDSAGWKKDNFKTFIYALEESNNGYHWDWDETKWKNLLFGGLFHIEQSEFKGKIYDHTRLCYPKKADDIRNNKYGSLPQDKLISGSTGTSGNVDEFVNVPEGNPDEIPFD